MSIVEIPKNWCTNSKHTLHKAARYQGNDREDCMVKKIIGKQNFLAIEPQPMGINMNQ